MWRWWVLANIVGLYLAPILARATPVRIGWNELIAGGIFACFQCLVLAPRSLRVLWLIPIQILLWDPAAVVFVFLIWRHGIDAAWELIIPFIDNDSLVLRTVLLSALQWVVLWSAFRITKWWIVASALGWLVGQFVMLLVPFMLPWFGELIGVALAGLIYGCATAYVLDQDVFQRTRISAA